MKFEEDLKDKIKNNLEVFDLKIGFKCNNNCVHCVVADKRPVRDLTLYEIKNTLKNIKSGTLIQITGGEPTFYPETLLYVLKYCRGKGLIATLQSNATGFSNEEFTKKCAPYIHNAHVAIHSSIPSIHNDIVGNIDNTMWQKTIKGIDNLVKYGVHITTQTVLSKKNIKSIPETFDFIQKRWPNTFMSLTYPHLMGNAWNNRYQVAFRYSDYKDIFQEVLSKYPDLIFTESIPLCYLHPYIKGPSVERDLLSREVARIGVDLASGTIEKPLNYNILDIQDRRKAPKCKECIYNNKCVGVWKEYIELFKNNLDLYPIKEEKNGK